MIVFSAPSSGEMQEWVMAMMALKFESDQRKNQPTADVPRQNAIYEPLGVGTYAEDWYNYLFIYYVFIYMCILDNKYYC